MPILSLKREFIEFGTTYDRLCITCMSLVIYCKASVRLYDFFFLFGVCQGAWMWVTVCISNSVGMSLTFVCCSAVVLVED